MLQAYLSFCRDVRLLKPKTIREYKYIIERMGKLIDWKHPGDQNAIESAILEAKRDGGWSQNYTAKVSGGVLVPWFSWLSEQNIIPFNPYIHNRFKKERLPEPHHFTQMEFDSIISDPRLTVQDHALLRFAWDSGARKSEILGLDQKDLDFKDNVAVIRRTKGGYSDGRYVPFTEETGEFLKQQISSLKKNGITEPVFVDFDWHRLGDSACDKRVREIGNFITPKRGAVRLHLHALRHSFATRAIKVLPQLTVAKILGHSSISQTIVYLHHSSKDAKEVREKLISC